MPKNAMKLGYYSCSYSPDLLFMMNFVRYVTWQDPFLMTKEQRTKALRRHREAETNTTKWSSKVDPFQLVV